MVCLFSFLKYHGDISHISLLKTSAVDPGFAAFRIPASGSGILDERNPDSDLESGIFGTLDPGWINFDPQSGIRYICPGTATLFNTALSAALRIAVCQI
jgi:hypothetical protein